MTTAEQNNLTPNDHPGKPARIWGRVVLALFAVTALAVVVTVGVRRHATSPETKLASTNSAPVSTEPPAKVSECISLLKEAVPDQPGLVSKVTTMVADAKKDGKAVANASRI